MQFESNAKGLEMVNSQKVTLMLSIAISFAVSLLAILMGVGVAYETECSLS